MAKFADLQIIGNRIYYKLVGCSDDEFMLIREYKSYEIRTWKFGLERKYFLFIHRNAANERILWSHLGFSPVCIRYLQSIGYNINGKELFRNRPINVPNTRFEPWDFQSSAIDSWRKRGYAGVIKMPTGSGKSFTSCKIIEIMKVQTLILVHTNDLFSVWFNTLVEQFGENIKSKIGVIGGNLSKNDRKGMNIIFDTSYEANIGKDIVIATSQSLLNQLDKLAKERFGLLIVDECLPYDTLINTSKGSFKIGNLYEMLVSNKSKDVFNNITTKILDFKTMTVIESKFIPKKTSIKKMYEITLINGIKFISSDDHKCLTCYDKSINKYCEYEEIKNIGNVGYLNKQTKKIEFSNIIERKFVGVEQGYDLEILNKNHNYFINDGINVHNCHHYPSEQFNKVVNNIGAPYRLGLSATLVRSDGASPLIWGLIGDICYKITIRELVNKKILVSPLFNAVVMNDPKIQHDISSCGLSKLDLSRFVKQKSASSIIKMKYIINLVENLCKNGRKIVMYTDFVNSENSEVFTRDFYVKELNRRGIRVIGVSSDMTGSERSKVFTMLEKGKLQVLVFGLLGAEGIDIPTIDTVLMCNGTKSTIRFTQRVGRGLRRSKTDINKVCAHVYEFVLNIPLEKKWSSANFFEYSTEGYVKKIILAN